MVCPSAPDTIVCIVSSAIMPCLYDDMGSFIDGLQWASVVPVVKYEAVNQTDKISTPGGSG